MGDGMISSVALEPNVGGRRKADMVSVYLSPELKTELEQWAIEEERSVSWLMAKLADKAIKLKKEGKNPLGDN
jgi:molybdopterin-guanine dinucleotide biosynthesis protein A